ATYNGSQQTDKMSNMADDLTELSTKLRDETARFKLQDSYEGQSTVQPKIDNSMLKQIVTMIKNSNTEDSLDNIKSIKDENGYEHF
ncbi:hypothetical protein QUF50_09930, partial [Thiotrichales bacterium HSG1]|nr:hypothetical protein [Thiotrichales bacterium HSG1]